VTTSVRKSAQSAGHADNTTADHWQQREDGGPILAVVAPVSGVVLQASVQAGPNTISAAMQDLSLHNTGPTSAPIPAATTVPTVTIPGPIPAVPDPAVVPPTILTMVHNMTQH
jgi:hypothetical protein